MKEIDRRHQGVNESRRNRDRERIRQLQTDIETLTDKCNSLINERDRTRKEHFEGIQQLEAQLVDYKEVLEDKQRLTKKLSGIFSPQGDRSKQPSLCDLIPVAKHVVSELAEAKKEIERLGWQNF